MLVSAKDNLHGNSVELCSPLGPLANTLVASRLQVAMDAFKKDGFRGSFVVLCSPLGPLESTLVASRLQVAMDA